MKSMKSLYSVGVVVICALLLVACSTNAGSSNSVSAGGEDKVLQYQGSPGSVNFAELAYDLGYLGDLKLEKIGDSTGGPESIQFTATGETDFGVAFNGSVMKSIAKGVKIKSVIGAIGANKESGMYGYALEGEGITSARDLIGKKVAVNILGANLEFVARAYLANNGLTDDEINQVSFVTLPAGSYEQSLRNKQVDVVILGSMSRDIAIENGGLVELFNEVDVVGRPYVSNSYFFTEDYIKKNPNTVKIFNEGLAKAIEWLKVTPREEVIARFEKIINGRQANETTKVIHYWRSPGIASEGGQFEDGDFQILLDWLEKSGEIKPGTINVKDVYTNEFNPYFK